MSNLYDLKRERDRLQNIEDVHKDMEAYDREKKKVKSDIWKMKHRKTVKVISVAKRSTVGVGMIFGRAGKAVAPMVKQGAKNFASNARSSVSQEPRIRKQRPIKRRKIKKVTLRRKPFQGGFFD